MEIRLSWMLAYRMKQYMHYDDVIMDSIASQITSLTIVYSTVHSGADQSKHQSSASLAFVWEIHRWPVNFPHKWPVTRKMFPFDDVIMCAYLSISWSQINLSVREALGFWHGFGPLSHFPPLLFFSCYRNGVFLSNIAWVFDWYRRSWDTVLTLLIKS